MNEATTTEALQELLRVRRQQSRWLRRHAGLGMALLAAGWLAMLLSAQHGWLAPL